MYSFKDGEIVMLLGAGASVDAKVPHSKEMITRLEKLISEDNDWKGLIEVYNFVKSSIYLSSGLHGSFNNDVNYNIEILVNTLDEITKKEDHILYPFVGAWNPRLIEIAGPRFEKISQLKKKILAVLRIEWLPLEDKDSASYYKFLIDFRNEYQFALRIFSLNYDLCLETAFEMEDQEYEMGFDEERIWNWRRLVEINPEDTPQFYYYKLHGSINWQYDKDNNLTFLDSSSGIREENAAIIFGTSYKLQYRDPFLFLAYEFRKWTIESKLIITVGYGFGDEHINGMIEQALNNKNHEHYLLVVSFLTDETEETEKREAEYKENLLKILNVSDESKLHCINIRAKDYFENSLHTNDIGDMFQFSQEEEIF